MYSASDIHNLKMNTESGNSYVPATANETITQKVIKSVIIVIFVIGLSKMGFNYYKGSEENYENEEKNGKEIILKKHNDDKETFSIKRIIAKQPSCPKSYMLVILYEICTELKLKQELCGPENIYNSKKKPHKNVEVVWKKTSNSEPKVSTLMNYVVGSLLITSLGAALIELYKAKKQEPKRTGKCPLSRKSSLADLTVMKHQRKELIRRESIMEVPEESLQNKQFGCNVSSLQRRCSFPLGPMMVSDGSGVNRTMSKMQETTPLFIAKNDGKTATFDIGKQYLEERRTSFDYQLLLVKEKRFSMDDSPERRRYRHLVHRH